MTIAKYRTKCGVLCYCLCPASIKSAPFGRTQHYIRVVCFFFLSCRIPQYPFSKHPIPQGQMLSFLQIPHPCKHQHLHFPLIMWAFLWDVFLGTRPLCHRLYGCPILLYVARLFWNRLYTLVNSAESMHFSVYCANCDVIMSVNLSF